MKSTCAFIVLLLAVNLGFSDGVRFVGVNIAGAEFTPNKLPGTHGQDYIYPTTAEIDYFIDKGMNIIRLPFRWERLQQTTNATFNATELGRIQARVNQIVAKGAHVLLDPHNYARYYNTNVIGSSALPISTFTNFWARLAAIYANHPQIIFGLMNEPHDMSTQVWRDAANGAIAAIRGVGATNLIFVPGNGWSIAHDWHNSWYGTPNASLMLEVVDPLNNFAFEVHDYFDSENTNRDCSPDVGINRLTQFTAWCRDNGKKGFYGEFGVSTNVTCLIAMSNMLAYVNTNADVWLGWSYWAAGPWWGNYRFSIEPANGQDRPQMDVLENFLHVPEPQISFRWIVPGTNAAFSFPLKPGFIYQPQATADLSSSWTNFGRAYTGGTFTASISMQSTSNAHQFFRVEVRRVP